jgi:hypothetical protein
MARKQFTFEDPDDYVWNATDEPKKSDPNVDFDFGFDDRTQRDEVGWRGIIQVTEYI